jgi:tetratricopeptide (TPR) repeat protein
MREPARALFEPHDLTSENTNAPWRTGPENHGRDGLAQRVAGLLQEGRFEAVLPCFADAESQGITPDWATIDRVATTLLHLGRPADARRVWERAAAPPPSQAVRLSRIATAALASQDFAAAREGFEAALKLDSGLGEAWFGLALLHAQLGEADEAAAACAGGLRRPLTEAQAALLTVFMELL